jgi:hypothetical protein
MIAKNVKYIFLFIGITPCISFTMISRLELVPGAGLVNVKLPYTYHVPTEEEKRCAKKVDEGCLTYIEKEGDCVLVGPCRPCQFIQLYNSDTGKAIVGHLPFNANKKSFLDHVKKEFARYDSSQISGTVFTAHFTTYDVPFVKIGTSTLSFKDFYKGKTQLEELKSTKDAIIAEFGIVDRDQIQAHKFNSKMKFMELGAYEFAESCIFAKYKHGAPPSLHSTCPMAEKMYGDFQHLPIQERLSVFTHARREVQAQQNPYLLQFSCAQSFVYGAYPFVKI